MVLDTINDIIKTEPVIPPPSQENVASQNAADATAHETQEVELDMPEPDYEDDDDDGTQPMLQKTSDSIPDNDITINGQKIPEHQNSIVLNGHVSGAKDAAVVAAATIPTTDNHSGDVKTPVSLNVAVSNLPVTDIDKHSKMSPVSTTDGKLPSPTAGKKEEVNRTSDGKISGVVYRKQRDTRGDHAHHHEKVRSKGRTIALGKFM